MKNRAQVLLIASSFFGYSKEIVKLLESQGRQVLWFEDRPATDVRTKALVRLAPALMAQQAETYFDQVIEKARQHAIEDVLIIKGESLSPAAIRRMRQALPKARFTLYFWDSYLNMPRDSSRKVAEVDRAFTFDPMDAVADTRLHYRPLFFLNEYAQLPVVKQDIDLLFFGTVHTDRYAVIQRIQKALPAGVGFERVLYFPTEWLYRYRRVCDPHFWGASRNEFIFKPLAKAEIMSLIARAKVVVDIERTIQTGYTMRTIEMLGAGRKLITTNPQVAQADFYNANNIAVIDRRRPKLSHAFLSLPYQAPPATLLQRYSLTGWLQELLPAAP